MLTAVGGRPDLRIIRSHCATQPEFVCDVLRAGNSPLVKDSAEAVDGFAADKRIRAVVLAAPGLGFTFSKGGLSNVAMPFSSGLGRRTMSPRMPATVQSSKANSVSTSKRIRCQAWPSFLLVAVSPLAAAGSLPGRR